MSLFQRKKDGGRKDLCNKIKIWGCILYMGRRGVREEVGEYRNTETWKGMFVMRTKEELVHSVRCHRRIDERVKGKRLLGFS